MLIKLSSRPLTRDLIEDPATAGSEDKSTRTLKLNRSAVSKAEETRTRRRASRRPDGDNAQANDEGDHQGGGRNRRNRNRRNRREPCAIGKSGELDRIKTKSTQELIDMAAEMGIENMARSRADIIFSLLKKHAKSGEDIFGTACLRSFPMVLDSCDQRTAHSAGPDDILSVRAKSDDSI